MRRVSIVAIVVLFFAVGCKKSDANEAESTDEESASSASKESKSEEGAKGDDEREAKAESEGEESESKSGDSEESSEKGSEESADKGGDVTCKKLVAHMHELMEKDKPGKADERFPKDFMTKMCNQANSIEKHRDTAECILASDSYDEGMKCDGRKAMAKEWAPKKK